MDLSVIFLLMIFALKLIFVETQSALKVTSSLPVTVDGCLLAEHFLPKKNSFSSCLVLCLKHPKCLLACYLDEKCNLYDVNVSSYYLGTNSTELRGYKCYSLWADKMDIAVEANYSSSSQLRDYSADNVKTGYGCLKTDSPSFHSNPGDTFPWIMADFKFPRYIKKVVIQVRINNYGTHFADVEVRVGNSSDINSRRNSLLMFYNGTAENGEIVTFESGDTLFGRYVTVQSLSGTFLVIPEMKIIEK
ncbi:UNVERIFIED_CONTAM: hypothetical protein RMT77_004196 [Armadillidium vulgare]